MTVISNSCHTELVTFDSSVGRAQDCNGYPVILMSLVRSRLEGLSFLPLKFRASAKKNSILKLLLLLKCYVNVEGHLQAALRWVTVTCDTTGRGLVHA